MINTIHKNVIRVNEFDYDFLFMSRLSSSVLI